MKYFNIFMKFLNISKWNISSCISNHYAKYGGDRESRAGCQRKSVMDTLPALNFVKKIAQGNLSHGGNFYQKFEIFAIFSYLSPYFYTDNVKISLKRTDRLRNLSKKNKFSSESLKGHAGIALPSGGDAYWFLVFFVFFCDALEWRSLW